VPRAFRLEVGADRLATLTFDLPGHPANLLTRAVLEELDATVGDLALDRGIGCLVLLSGKPDGFAAGVDPGEITGADPVEVEAGARFGQRLLAAWETLPFPTVAAVRGACLGGGAELALASSYLLFSDRSDVEIGLPEARLGLLPAWGACGRLLRRAGLAAALDLLSTGRAIPPERALALGLADAVLPDAVFLQEVRRFSEVVADRPRPPRPRRRAGFARRLLEGTGIGRSLLLAQARARLPAEPASRPPAPLAILDVVRVHLERGEAAGREAEVRALGRLSASGEAADLFHLSRSLAGRVAPASGGDFRHPRAPAVVGAGETGGTIARLLVARGEVPVRLLDSDPAVLASALAGAVASFRGRTGEAEARRRAGLLRPAVGWAGLARCDLVIEALADDLEAKRRAMAEITARAPAGAILASTSASLPVEEIAEGLPGPERFVGWVFPHPVRSASMVEVVRTRATSAEVVAAVSALARDLGRTPVTVTDGPGFLVGRLLGVATVEALWLLDEGFATGSIDEALVAWGLATGPLRRADEVGLEETARLARRLAAAFPDRFSLPSWFDTLAASGRLGRRSGRGFYRWGEDGRYAEDAALSDFLGLVPHRVVPAPGAVAERIVLAMVNEAARCLAEGVVASPAELDLAMVLGGGVPAERGGLCRWAENQGLDRVIEKLQGLAGVHGPRLEPSPALLAAAARQGFASATSSTSPS